MFFWSKTSWDTADFNLPAVLQRENTRLSESEHGQLTVDTTSGNESTERLEQKRLKKKLLEQETARKVRIHLYLRVEDNTWEELSPLMIDPLNPIEVERMTIQKLKQHMDFQC
jgi:hypothetical protein